MRNACAQLVDETSAASKVSVHEVGLPLTDHVTQRRTCAPMRRHLQDLDPLVEQVADTGAAMAALVPAHDERDVMLLT